MPQLALDRSLVRHFADLEDPRCELKRRHKLIDMIVIAIAAMLFGADGWAGIAVGSERLLDLRFKPRLHPWLGALAPSRLRASRVCTLNAGRGGEAPFPLLRAATNQ